MIYPIYIYTYKHVYLHTYNLREFAPNLCCLLPRTAILCDLEMQFGHQLMLETVNARGCQTEVPPFIDVGLVLGSLGHFVVPCLCTYMCVWTSLSLYFWSPASTWSSQIDSMEAPNRFNFDLDISTWDTQSPTRVPEVPGNP